MKIFVRGLVTVMFAVAFSPLYAQTGSLLAHGKIITGEGSPLAGATVSLLNSKDSSLVSSSLSDNTGLFSINNIRPGSYILTISKTGYKRNYSGPYQINGKNTNLGLIALTSSFAPLSGVTITGKKDYIETSSGKKVLNIEQNPVAAGNSVYDVLASSPGVKIVGEQVLMRGNQEALVAVNGKPVLMSGEELISLLKNYQASSVSQIELIDNPGSKFDAAGGGGMINIVLKKNKELGSKFTITGSGAYGDKYKFNTGINWTLKTEKLDVFASYGFQDSKIPHLINTDRTIVTDGQVDNLDLDYNAAIKSLNRNFTVSADYQLAPGQTIGFLINGYYNNSNINKRSTTSVYTNNKPDSSIIAQSDISRNINNTTYNLNYKANLDKAGKSILSASGYYSNYQRHSDENLENNFLNNEGEADAQPIFYRDHSPSHITIRSENIDFSQQLSNAITMEAGVKNSQVNSDNQIDFEQKLNNNFVPVTSLTDHFVYKERIDAGYLNFNGNFNQTSITASLRGERTSSSGISLNPAKRVFRSYFDLFPNVQLTQTLDKNNQLTAFYSRNVERPNYQDLNPFVGYVDKFYYSTGNPFLNPDYINTFQVSDLLLDKYKGSLSMIITDNFFYTIFQQDDFTRVYTVTKANLGTRYQYQAEFDIPVDITKWWHIDADFTAFHERYLYKPDTIAKKTSNGITLYVDHDFKISSKLSAQLYNAYESPTYFAISHYTTLWYMNAGFRYSILHNDGSIRLSVSDIFNTYYNNYHTDYTNLNLNARDRQGSRFVGLTFTYRFGNSSVKTGKATKATDEQKRLGSSSNEN